MKRVAVIAVHGVADQPPTATVHAIGDLLANLETGAGAAYGPFEEERIDIPVRRVEEPCVLKVSWTDEAASSEAMALAAWNGQGAVRLLASQPALGALLLERLDHRPVATGRHRRLTRASSPDDVPATTGAWPRPSPRRCCAH